MDIRTRLLELPTEYRHEVLLVLEWTAARANADWLMARLKAETMGRLAERWANKATSGNEQSRKAELEAELDKDPAYRDEEAILRDADEHILASTKKCEILRYELQCLQSVVALGKPEKEA